MLIKSEYSFNFLGVGIAMDVPMLYASILMILGCAIILIAWITLYHQIQQTSLVTKGIYSLSRHPQYFGFLLIIVGWFIGWPTILTAIFIPILDYKYIKVCLIEEKELMSNKQYINYQKKVPFFI